WESMLLTKPGRCDLGEEASEPCLKVALRGPGDGRSQRLLVGVDQKWRGSRQMALPTLNGRHWPHQGASATSPPGALHLHADSTEHESVCRIEERSFLFQSIKFREPSICLLDRKAGVLDHELMDKAR